MRYGVVNGYGYSSAPTLLSIISVNDIVADVNLVLIFKKGFIDESYVYFIVVKDEFKFTYFNWISHALGIPMKDLKLFIFRQHIGGEKLRLSFVDVLIDICLTLEQLLGIYQIIPPS